MRKLNIAEGILILLGFLLIVDALIIKFKGVNLLEQILKDPGNLLIAANTCFIIAFVVAVFGNSTRSE